MRSQLLYIINALTRRENRNKIVWSLMLHHCLYSPYTNAADTDEICSIRLLYTLQLSCHRCTVWYNEHTGLKLGLQLAKKLLFWSLPEISFYIYIHRWVGLHTIGSWANIMSHTPASWCHSQIVWPQNSTYDPQMLTVKFLINMWDTLWHKSTFIGSLERFTEVGRVLRDMAFTLSKRNDEDLTQLCRV